MPDKKIPQRLFLGVFAGIAALLVTSGAEIFNFAWGSGHFFGRLSSKWVLFIALYAIFAALLATLTYFALLKPKRFAKTKKYLLNWPEKIGVFRWVLFGICVSFPAYFVFYSPWSVLAGVATRVLILIIFVAVATYLLVTKRTEPFTWKTFLIAALAAGSVLALAESFVLVTNYPFALHWSEGNRLWDYSVLFGRARYNYPASDPIFAWIDSGRQVLWGLPFLIPSLPIWGARFWGALLTTIPYALLGWFAFRPLSNARGQWHAVGLWTLIFLNQGPIYTPLVLAAILVAFTRRRTLWLAIPLIFLAGYYAGSSRFTWSFAPAIWALMLTLSDGVLLNNGLTLKDWLRAGILTLAGLWTKGLPIILGVLGSLFVSSSITDGTTQGITTVEGLQAVTTKQPFLWYRLFPNETYPLGILFGLIVATLPVVLLLIYLAKKGFLKTVFWQRLILLAGVGAFLIVGLIASIKVGGGADLHNMDMFLIALVLLAGVAWEAGFYKRLETVLQRSSFVKWSFAGLILIPSLLPLLSGRPLQLPSEERTQFVLQRIQQKVACARQYGPVLFMDQRQLITFGYVGNLPLVVDYEKKFVMDQALGSNKAYFDQFDADLANHRFALIVSEREGTLYKELDQESIGDSLVEENNAWITWVTIPLLTYYESVGDYKDAAVELFMPIERNFDCP